MRKLKNTLGYKNVIKVGLILTISLLSQIALSQTQKSLNRTDSLYKSSPFNVQWVKFYYSNLGDTSPVLIDSGTIARHGGNYCQSKKGHLVIISEGLTLHIDHQNQKITLDSVQAEDYIMPNKPVMDRSDFFPMMDSMVLDSNTVRYIVPSVSSGVAFTYIDLDTKSGIIERISYYSEVKKLYQKEITRFYSSTVGEAPPSVLFSMSNYIYKQSGSYKLTSTYRHYTFINNL